MITKAATDTIEQSTPRPGFALGLLTGGIIGTVLALAFAPRAGADLRRGVASAGKKLGNAASEQYQDASARVGDAVGHLVNKVQAAGDDAADAVVSGADEIARVATALKH
jgi:gas vesicle protein